MADAEVPDGAAVFPEIPASLGVNPLTLAVLHATVFLAGSDDSILDATAADEAVDHLAGYLQRLEPAAIEQLRADLRTIEQFGRREGWPNELYDFLGSFVTDFGIGEEGDDADD